VKPTFFESPDAFREWLQRNHDKQSELLVGFYKKGSGRPSITWPESVDQALCFGWIDGVRKRIDEDSYSIRFTPRKKSSNWSAINIRRVAELVNLGLMQATGLRAFENRREDKSAIYSYENQPRKFAPAYEKKFRANKGAWKYFTEQAPSYQRMMMFYVMSARKEETQVRRLAAVIRESARGKRIGLMPARGAQRSAVGAQPRRPPTARRRPPTR